MEQMNSGQEQYSAEERHIVMPCGSTKQVVQCPSPRCYSYDFDYYEVIGNSRRVVCWKCGIEYFMSPYGLLDPEDFVPKSEASRVIWSNVKRETWGERKRRRELQKKARE